MRKHIKADKKVIDFFSERKIFFDLYSKNGSCGLIEGQDLTFDDGLEYEPYTTSYGRFHLKCKIGFHSMSMSDLPQNFRLGRYCSVANGLNFLGRRHPMEYVTTHDFVSILWPAPLKSFISDEKIEYKKTYPELLNKQMPICDNDVWIGQNVVLNPGVHISTGAVIAAESVVTKNVGAYEVVGGNPAKLIKKRFSDEVIELMLQTEWWKYKFTNFVDLPLNDPKIFAKEFLEIKASLTPYNPPILKFQDICSALNI